VEGRGTAGERSYVQIELTLQANAAPGVRDIKLRRPRLGGKDESIIKVNLQKNYRIDYVSPLRVNGQNVSGRVAMQNGDEVMFDVFGKNLTLLKGIRTNILTLGGTGIFKDVRVVSGGGSAGVSNTGTTGSLSGTVTSATTASTVTNGTISSTKLTIACKLTNEGLIRYKDFFRAFFNQDADAKLFFPRGNPDGTIIRTSKSTSGSGSNNVFNGPILIEQISDRDRGINP